MINIFITYYQNDVSFIQNINASNDPITFDDKVTLLTYCGMLNNGPLKISMSLALESWEYVTLHELCRCH